MISIAFLRTRRLAVQCRELTLGDAIAICKMDGQRHESVTTAVLRSIIERADVPRPGFVADPQMWTVSERMRVMAHYLSSVGQDGPDFSIGDESTALKFSDYADLAIESESLEVRALASGKEFMIRPLLGIHAELLERSCTSRGEWVVGAMACQMSEPGKEAPSLLDMTEVDRLEWIGAQLLAARSSPESDFEEKMGAYFAAQDSLKQWFNLSFDDEGVIAMPSRKEAGPQPARFPPLSVISPATRALFERPRQ
jgi:hypothetical protein